MSKQFIFYVDDYRADEDLPIWEICNKSPYDNYYRRCAVNRRNGWHPLSDERIAKNIIINAESFAEAEAVVIRFVNRIVRESAEFAD